jgi:hypothetical protein
MVHLGYNPHPVNNSNKNSNDTKKNKNNEMNKKSTVATSTTIYHPQDLNILTSTSSSSTNCRSINTSYLLETLRHKLPLYCIPTDDNNDSSEYCIAYESPTEDIARVYLIAKR